VVGVSNGGDGMVAENREGGVDADTICRVDSATNGVADSSKDGWSDVWDTNDDCGCICAAIQLPYKDGGLIGVQMMIAVAYMLQLKLQR